MSLALTPINIPAYNIWDILHNPHGEIVLITAGINGYSVNAGGRVFTRYDCSHGHSTVFVLSNIDYTDQMSLHIDNTLITTKVNKYPSFPNQLIMSTSVKREDNYILQWIKYHMTLGVSRFVIYDNADNVIPVGEESSYMHTNLSETLREYISAGIVVLINWHYNKKYQQTQQNHSIHAFSDAAFIGMFDIDEYVNPLTPETNLATQLPLQLHQYNISADQIGGLQIFSKLFSNPSGMPVDGYEFLKIYTCTDTIYHEKEKLFIIPRSARTMSVHKITNGRVPLAMNDRDIMFNHYTFLNKKDRGRNNTGKQDVSIKRHVDNLLCITDTCGS